MPQVCNNCHHHAKDADPSDDCPECGGWLRYVDLVLVDKSEQ